MDNTSRFKSVVFAGGGSRCFWQLGFWSTAAPALNIRPLTAAGVSAGAAFACFSLSADGESVLHYFKNLASANKKNFYLTNLFRKAPMFPHYNMYRKSILNTINPEVLLKLMNGPDIRILIARPPRWMGAISASIAGVVAYNIEKHIFHPLHPVFASKLGFKGEIVSVKECGTSEELAELIMQSSCAPPLLPVMKRNNRVALDGGMIDNVPVSLLDHCAGDKLVLLTRRYKDGVLPENNEVTYLQPSENIPITKWEYTDPEGLQYVYDMGRRDGDAFAKQQLLL